jgi:hypothetical protein
MARLVKPDQVRTLRDWVARWPKADNLEFDADTREASVYAPVKRNQEGRNRVATIPWKREGDVITILSQPERFTAGAVTTARRRMESIRTNQIQARAGAEDQIRQQEAAVMAAWRAYREAPAMSRGALMRDVLTAERALNEMETTIANELQKQRTIYNAAGMVGIYNPPIPPESRGIPLTEIAANAEQLPANAQ